MQIIFADLALQELFELGKTKNSKYKKIQKSKKLLSGYQRVVSTMQGVERVADLRQFSFLHYESLKHEYQGMSSVRIVNGEVECLIFSETDNGITVRLIEIDSTHYGNR